MSFYIDSDDEFLASLATSEEDLCAFCKDHFSDLVEHKVTCNMNSHKGSCPHCNKAFANLASHLEDCQNKPQITDELSIQSILDCLSSVSNKFQEVSVDIEKHLESLKNILSSYKLILNEPDLTTGP